MKDKMLHALSMSLHDLQNNCIGLFKNHYPNSPLSLVIEDDGQGNLRTIDLKELGGFDDDHIPASKGKYVKFPDGLNLQKMKDMPFTLQAFIKDNFGVK